MRLTDKTRTYTFLVLLTLALTVLVYIAPHAKAPKELVIADVQPNSPRIVKDDGSIEFADNLQIRNLTDHLYDLTGYYLSDKRGDLQKLPLDGVVIEPFGNARIKLDPSWNFGLHAEGDENIYLSDDRGNVLFQYTPDMKPEEPEFSAPSGFYSDEFELTLSCDKGHAVFYTLDGSNPADHGIPYTAPIRVYDRSSEPNTVVNVPNTIRNYLDDEVLDNDTGEHIPIEKPIEEPVDKAFIVRAATIDEYGNKSDIVTREYFFCGDKYRNIISVVADRNDLFGDYGILSTGKEYDDWYLNGQDGESPDVNYKQRGRDWEVPADINYFRDGSEVLKQECGLKLQGRTTRDRRIKNFQLRARNSYSGSDVFEYDFFDEEPFRSDGLILDDNYRESFFLALIANEDIVKQKTTDAAALFLNGEYWNTVYIRQKIDEKYFEDHYGIQPDNLIILSESFPETDVTDEDQMREVQQLYTDIDEFARDNDLSNKNNYAMIQTMMDIDSYIDYLAINTWAGNTDWGEYNNDMYWRTKIPDGSEYGDGRFRWMIHDGDYVFDKNMKLEDFSMLYDGPLYPALMRNDEFRQKFANRLIRLGNTAFSEENVEKIISSGKWDSNELSTVRDFFATRKDEISEIIQQYGHFQSKMQK